MKRGLVGVAPLLAVELLRVRQRLPGQGAGQEGGMNGSVGTLRMMWPRAAGALQDVIPCFAAPVMPPTLT